MQANKGTAGLLLLFLRRQVDRREAGAFDTSGSFQQTVHLTK